MGRIGEPFFSVRRGVALAALEDLVSFVVLNQQAGFIKGRQMETHLVEVQRTWKTGREGAWLNIDFSKAFDSTSHCLLRVFLELLGISSRWCTTLIQFLKGSIRFLVGNHPHGRNFSLSQV